MLAVLYPHRSFLPAKVRVFSDYLVEHTRSLLSADLAL